MDSKNLFAHHAAESRATDSCAVQSRLVDAGFLALIRSSFQRRGFDLEAKRQRRTPNIERQISNPNIERQMPSPNRRSTAGTLFLRHLLHQLLNGSRNPVFDIAGPSIRGPTVLVQV